MSLDIKVKDIMSKEVLKIDFKETVQSAAETMSSNRVGSLIVVFNSARLVRYGEELGHEKASAGT